MSSSKNFELKKTDFLSKSNSTFIDEMYMKFVNNDPSLPNSWRSYFNEIGDEPVSYTHLTLPTTVRV